jgi:opacity protein-like surface antigen
MRRLWIAGLPVLLVAFALAAAEGGRRIEWMLLGGLGRSHPGLGDTEERVETVDLVIRRAVTMASVDRGRCRVNHSFMVEAPVYIVTDPDTSSMYGLNFLACWGFEVSDRFEPYVFAGGGPVYTEAGIPGMGAHMNGNYQAGIGVRFKPGSAPTMVLEYRYHHISNGDRVDPNVPLNSTKALIGVSLTF